MKLINSIILSLFIFLSCVHGAVKSPSTITNCDVLIVGGSTAALGAALSASAYVKTCLLEPTDWAGGQLTAEGLPAIDFAWHQVVDPVNNFTVDVAAINRDFMNRNPTFTQILKDASAVTGMDNPGRCWVSIVCTMPIDMLGAIQKQIDLRQENLTIYYKTVVKKVTKDPTGRKILEVEAIQRQSLGTSVEFTFLSEEIEDWYTPEDSAQYNKSILNFAGFNYVADMTSFGEVMVLANASYLQGIAERYDGDVSGQGGSDTCGQSFAWDFTEYISQDERDDILVPNPPNSPPINESWFSLQGHDWTQIVTYRRVKAQPDEHSQYTIEAEDVTVQNWNKGNDQKWIYILLSRADTAAQVQDWRGGLNMDAVVMGEALAVEFHRWFRKNAPSKWANRTVISPETMNTTTGLARMPYLRDSRRSIGIGDFVVTIANLSGTAEQIVGTIFEDRVGLGAYDVDIHANVNCTYPEYMNLTENTYSILPYYIPFRALTNRDIDNLLVAGKTMATSFLANAAMRLHPEEFTSGQAAGAAMAFAVMNNITSTTEILNQIESLQEFVKQFTPLSWMINGTYYPPENQTLSAEYLDMDILQM